jgi:DNA-binding NarL/FixJ family response regulator
MDIIKVLIADDQALMRDGLKVLLNMEDDIEVVGTARDGKEVISLVDELNPDLVLMDIRMPGINGVEATRQIKERHPDIIILALTTFNDEEYIIDILNYGAKGYLLKDMDSEKLAKSIRDAFNGNLIMPSEVAVKLAQNISKEKKGNVLADSIPTHSFVTNKIKDGFDFTQREMEIAAMLAQGFTNKQIASALYISEGTVKNNVSTIYSKIGISDRAAAAIFLRSKI